MKKKENYKVALILPETKEGKDILETAYANVLAKITLKKLNAKELKELIDSFEKQK
ncbi:hypothetical protein [Clostridium saccharoperbutylacetonicum]|uniref:hypothetical protein n=1 Tax=Clostridium saccharoperbutylacetonicum TaxID=36745 RepID=UPI0009839A4B|nr:hypothetical protein [Clostridium saccharoperbutylacetonicum]AQR95520.1 hypothetical protein CLSAP_28360 [Clostridium saccharoperbutylacetonicum]NSB31380.1 hypothetical protein [Clostridium saccharoperbutylacetonicum]